uniref:Cyanovirin-N domain-containing protein n=1 Tax=Bionectria ochroleuca TaxID=29856 RepID=A0A8H7TVR9_BIOOC
MKIAVILAAVAIATVEGAWQCRCESRDSVKAGINEICRQLNSNWTSRECFLGLYGNCHLCTYDPAGDYDRASKDRLDSWCRSQSYVSNNFGSADFSIRCYRK